MTSREKLVGGLVSNSTNYDSVQSTINIVNESTFMCFHSQVGEIYRNTDLRYIAEMLSDSFWQQ